MLDAIVHAPLIRLCVWPALYHERSRAQMFQVRAPFRYPPAMQYRTFGRLNWKVSAIGFGAWAIGGSWGAQSEDDSVKALHTALDLGCNFIDTAQVYGDGKSERIIAK